MFNFSPDCIVDGDFLLSNEIDRWKFQQMLELEFRVTSQNFSFFSQLFFLVSKGGPKKKCWKTIHWSLAIFQHFSFGVVIGICNYTKNRKRKSKSTFSQIFQVHGRRKQLGFSSGSICFRTRFLPLLPSLQHLLQGHRTLGYAFINNRFLRERGMASKPKMEYQVFLCIFQIRTQLWLS